MGLEATKQITEFEDYVAKYCKTTDKKGKKSPIPLEDTIKYAETGRQFLEDFHNNPNIQRGNLREQAACLQWYLIKSSFEQGKNIGKGMFIIEMDPPEKTKQLFDYFRNDAKVIYSDDKSKHALESAKFTAKGMSNALNPFHKEDTNPTYNRSSTHFIPTSGQSYGIDNKDKNIPLPFGFTTTCFGMVEGSKMDEGGNDTLYVKPETEGANALEETGDTMRHGKNLAVTMIKGGEQISDLGRFAESADGKSYGDAIRMKFDGKEFKLVVPEKKVEKKVEFDVPSADPVLNKRKSMYFSPGAINSALAKAPEKAAVAPEKSPKVASENEGKENVDLRRSAVRIK